MTTIKLPVSVYHTQRPCRTWFTIKLILFNNLRNCCMRKWHTIEPTSNALNLPYTYLSSLNIRSILFCHPASIIFCQWVFSTLNDRLKNVFAWTTYILSKKHIIIGLNCHIPSSTERKFGLEVVSYWYYTNM